MPIICVMGATGTQGGSVCAALQMNGQWTVRGITRNPDGAAAKKLADQGVEIAMADAADELSLLKAFEGATAIYALTNYNWTIATDKGLHAAGEQEKNEATNIAKAASQIHSLKHFVMSSLPPANLISNKMHSVPHFDYKYMAYQWIETYLPELASKTTLVWLGWYTSNLAHVPLARFIPIPGTDNYIWAQPSKATAYLPLTGDVLHNVGVVVEGILNTGAEAYGKIAIIVTDYLEMEGVVKAWEGVTGKKGTYIELSDDSFEHIWGKAGAEIAAQMRWSEQFPAWEEFFPGRFISFEELGVRGKIRNVQQALQDIKDALT